MSWAVGVVLLVFCCVLFCLSSLCDPSKVCCSSAVACVCTYMYNVPERFNILLGCVCVFFFLLNPTRVDCKGNVFFLNLRKTITLARMSQICTGARPIRGLLSVVDTITEVSILRSDALKVQHIYLYDLYELYVLPCVWRRFDESGLRLL